MSARPTDPKRKKHAHTFHALWDHFGPLGRQDVHYHPCYDDERCRFVLVGPGRDCDGNRATHQEQRL